MTDGVWIAKLTNNTDFPRGTEFQSVEDISKFAERYYRGKPGNLYSERWEVEGEYPDDLFDILSPSEGDDGWHLKK